MLILRQITTKNRVRKNTISDIVSESGAFSAAFLVKFCLKAAKRAK